MKKVLIFGAFDRYNYGDLLFPYMIEHQLTIDNVDLSFEFFGIINSDLSKYGGKETLGISSFYQRCNNQSDKVEVVIAGGEALDATWDSMYNSFSRKGVVLSKLKRYLRIPIFVNSFCKIILGGKTVIPFGFSKNNFKGVNNIVYNSLGGSNIGRLPTGLKKVLQRNLQGADYLSVRDFLSLENLNEISIRAKLSPDSAILMSEVFPMYELMNKVSAEVKKYVSENKSNYMFFQVNNSIAQKHLDEIVMTLNEIIVEKKMKVCLCPIGKASGHLDHLGLNLINSKLTYPCVMFEEVSIWDIMYLIGNSKIYVGTSLHGVITAMSFRVPYLGIQVKKVDSYLKTWGVTGLDRAINFKDVCALMEFAFSIEEKKLEESYNFQAYQVKESFVKIKKVLAYNV